MGAIWHSLSNRLALPSLKELDVSSNNIDILDGRHLASFPSLQRLDLSANRVSTVKNIESISRLQMLYLPYNVISSLEWLEGLKHRHAPRLEVLDLRDNAIEEAKELAYLAHCTALKDLKLRGRDGNPVCERPDYVELIFELCPQLEVLDGHSVVTHRQELAKRRLEREEGRGAVHKADVNATPASDTPSHPPAPVPRREQREQPNDVKSRGRSRPEFEAPTPRINELTRRFKARRERQQAHPREREASGGASSPDSHRFSQQQQQRNAADPFSQFFVSTS